MKKLHVWPHRVVIRLVTIRDRGPIVCHCGFELRNTAGCNSSRFQQTLWHTKQSTLFKTTIFGGTPSSGIKWVQVEGLEIRPYRMIRTGKKYRDRRKIIKTILYKIIYIYICLYTGSMPVVIFYVCLDTESMPVVIFFICLYVESMPVVVVEWY